MFGAHISAPTTLFLHSRLQCNLRTWPWLYWGVGRGVGAQAQPITRVRVGVVLHEELVSRPSPTGTLSISPDIIGYSRSIGSTRAGYLGARCCTRSWANRRWGGHWNLFSNKFGAHVSYQVFPGYYFLRAYPPSKMNGDAHNPPQPGQWCLCSTMDRNLSHWPLGSRSWRRPRLWTRSSTRGQRRRVCKALWLDFVLNSTRIVVRRFQCVRTTCSWQFESWVRF